MSTRLTAAGVAELPDLLAAHPGCSLVVGMHSGAGGPRGGEGSAVAAALTGIDPEAIARADAAFDGERGSLSVAVVPSGAAAVRLVLVGLGPEPPLREDVFSAALAAGRHCRAGTAVSLLALEAPAVPVAVELVAQGHAAGAWEYGREEAEAQVVVLGAADGGGLERARLLAEATAWVRRLVETPANRLGPRAFAEAIRAFCAETAGAAVEVTVWDEAVLAERGFGGTLGVGAGGSEPPLVVELRTGGGGPLTGLAGKGITFDSGGIDLKRDASELAWMKSDMAAAASVAAAVAVVAALGGAGPLHAVLPVAENLPGPRAQRPGDVVRHPDGTTTEVVDTDCEGRLVLADALAWLAREQPARLVDVGTLTDSGAVGTAFWGCWGTSARLTDELVAAGEAAADRGWALPLHAGYRSLLSSRVADIANAPTEAPDSGQLAATYLRAFAGEVPWAHIDNGSSAWLEHEAWPWPEGPTATPLRALVEWLRPDR